MHLELVNVPWHERDLYSKQISMNAKLLIYSNNFLKNYIYNHLWRIFKSVLTAVLYYLIIGN